MNIAIQTLLFLCLSLSLLADEELSLGNIFNLMTDTVSKKQESIYLAPSNVTVINSDQIKSWGSRTIKDVLKRIPGFQVIPDRDEWVFASRGNVSDNNTKYLILIDGHRMNSVENFGPGQIIEAPFDLSTVKKIEVIRGPGSAVWGPDALAGVINIKTKDASDYKNTKNLSATYGSGNTIRANTQLTKTVNEKASAVLSASYVQSQGHEITQDISSGLGTTTNGTGESFNTHVDRHPQSYMFHLKTILDDLKVNAMHFNTRTHNRHYETETGKNALLTTEKTFIESIWETNINDNDHVTWKTWYHSNMAHYQPDGFSGLFIQWKDNIFGSSIDSNRFFNNSFNMIYGLEFVHTRVGPNPRLNPADVSSTNDYASSVQQAKMISASNESDDSIGGYSMLEFTPYENWKLVAGARVDYNQDRGRDGDELSINPRLSVAWKYSNSQSVKLMYNQGFLQPSNFNKAPNIDGEVMKQLEIQWLTKWSKSYITTTLFKQKLEGFINITGNNISGFINAGDYESEGVEVEFSHNLGSSSRLWLNLSYVNATGGDYSSNVENKYRRVKDVNKRSVLLSYAPFVANLGSEIKLNDFTFAPAIRYVGKTWYRSGPQESGGDSSLLSNEDYLEHSKTDALLFADINIGYQYNKNLYLNLYVDNILDETGPTHNTVWNGEVGLAGRVIEGQLSYSFN